MKPRACSQCGDWYNPKFQGTETLCGKCHLKKVIQEKEVEEDKQKVKTPPTANEPRTTSQPEPQKRTLRYELNGAEYRGECNKCGLWVEGKEVYSQERGWIMKWFHVNYDRTRSNYCLVA